MQRLEGLGVAFHDNWNTFARKGVIAALAGAHDSWISQNGLRSPKGEWCCGFGDCGWSMPMCRDSTVGPPKPMGTRGATMADTVGEAAD